MKKIWILFAIVVLSATDRFIVLNSLAETISEINLETGSVSQNIAITGVAPNAIYISENGENLFVLNSTSSSLQIFDTETVAQQNTFDLGTGNNPWAMAIVGNIGFVTNFQTSTASKIDLNSGEILATFDVPGTPEGILFHDEKLYIACPDFDFDYWTYGQGKVRVFSATSLEQIDEYNVHTNPQSLLIDSNENLHVICTGDYWGEFGVVDVINLQTGGNVASLNLGGSPGNFAINENGIIAVGAGGWDTEDYVFSYDANSLEILRDATNPIIVGPGAGNVSAVGLDFFISCFSDDRIYQISQTGEIVNSFLVGDGPVASVVIEEGILLGDVNFDGSINVLDVIQTVQFVLNEENPTADEFTAADVNGDQILNVLDVIGIVVIILDS